MLRKPRRSVPALLLHEVNRLTLPNFEEAKAGTLRLLFLFNRELVVRVPDVSRLGNVDVYPP